MSQTGTFSTILSVNPYQHDYYSSSLNTLSLSTSPSFKKDQYALSFLNSKSFISALISVSKNVPDDDIPDALENKTYEELALDTAMEYQIRYIEAIHHANDNDRFFHIFVVEPSVIEEEFTAVVETIKYVDQIIPIPLLLKALYAKDFIDSEGAHGFVYFQKNDAFFALYDRQEYIYSKSLKYSLTQMHERYCELLGEVVTLANFEILLITQGRNTENEEHQEVLLKLFGEILLHINDVILYAKRVFEIKQLDALYMGASVGVIDGLDEYGQTALNVKIHPFDFDFGFTTSNATIDRIHQLMHVYARLEPEEGYDCNFTEFHRPPPFVKRDSGKLILAIAASFVIAFLYPGAYWAMAYAEDFHYAMMSRKYQDIHPQKIDRETKVNERVANQKQAQALLDDQQANYKQKQDTLLQVHEKKVNYPMKAKIIADFTQSFNRYRVKLNGIDYHEDNMSVKTFSFKLNATKTQDITALLKELTANKSDKYNFSLQLIAYDTNSSSYLSELKADLKKGENK